MSSLKDNDIILLEKFKSIKNTFVELEDVSQNLFINLKKSFLIDNKMVFEEEFDLIKSDIADIEYELINEVIPNVNNRL